MRSKTILSISLLSVAALSSACSRHRAAAAPTPSNAVSADRAAIDAAERENAKLRADADNSSSDTEHAPKASDRSAITTPVYFEFDRSEITDEGIRLLDQKVDALQRNASVHIRIEGNADDSGSDEYNMALSQKRAGVVNRYFAERGIDASRIQ